MNCGFSSSICSTREPGKQREVYCMRNDTQLPGRFICSDSDSRRTDEDRDVHDCYENLGFVYDYYKDVHGRNSIDNTNGKLIGSVHYRGLDLAFWDQQLVFCDSSSPLYGHSVRCLDIVGHEFTHGVIHSTARLDYKGQSGALNESIADVFGSLVKQYAEDKKSKDADWLIGGDCFLPDIKGAGLRSMKAPGTAYKDVRVGADPQPDSMNDYVVWPETKEKDWGGVHINSGIPNRAFYLVATGLADASLEEYTWKMAGPIWYDSIHKNRNCGCSFKEFAIITCEVASQLKDTKELKDVGARAERVVKTAWETVGVLESVSKPSCDVQGPAAAGT